MTGHLRRSLLAIGMAALTASAAPSARAADAGRSPAPAAQGAKAAPAGQDELAARSQAAARAMKQGRFDEAATLYREMLQAIPDEPGLLMNLGMALGMGGRDAEAIGPLQRAIGLRASLLPAHLFLGSSLLALGRAGEAVAPLEHVVAARPADPQSRDLLARALLAANRPDEAAAEFAKLTTITPREPSAWYGLGQAYNAVVQAALATFDAEGDSPWRTLLLADALREDGRLGSAFRLYRRVIPALDGTRAAQRSLVTVYEKSGHADWAAAQRKLADAVAIDCARLVAECAFEAGRYQAALSATAGKTDPASRYWRARAATALAKAAFAGLEGLPDSRERRELRAELARAAGRHVDAVEEIKVALQFAPGDPQLRHELAISYHLARDYESALATVTPLARAAPDNASLQALYGSALLELQRFDEALPVLARAVELAPGDADARAALGRAYVQKGRFAEAIPLITPLLAGDRDGTLHFQLARAYQGAGQPERAKPLLEQYQQLQQASRAREAEGAESAIVEPGASLSPDR